MSAGHMTLSGECLFSKWGFGDGDMPDELLDMADGWPAKEKMWAYDFGSKQWHEVLRRLVRERLLPLMPAGVELVDINTIHNPIRADKVNGEDIGPFWTSSADVPDRFAPFTAVSVDVPYEDMLAMMREESDR